MKACHRLAILIGLSILVPHSPLIGQERNASSNANRRMRIRPSSSLALARMEAVPLPKYPTDAIDKHIEGTVILHVIVSDDGTVKQAEATFGPSELTKSAIDAVKQWRFGKTFLNQQPVEIDTTLALVYALRPIPAVSVDKDYKPAPGSNTSTQEEATTNNAPSSVRNARPNKGVIDGTTYKNSSIGLQFTPAAGLRVEQMNAAASNMIAVRAQNDPGPMYGLTVFYADELAQYPEGQRSAPRYLEKVVRANEADGFQLTEGEPSTEISGVQFVRADFVRGAVHETILVMTHNGYAFVFIFSGASAERTRQLIASTDLKVTP
jgi:TonB family protein